MGFRVFAHTADIGMEVEAPDLDALFRDAARGLFSVIRGENPVAGVVHERVSVQADRLDRLLVAFLEEFLFLQDAEGLVFADVQHLEVRRTDTGWTAQADVHGEPFSHERHPGCLHVKAVTRHELALTEPAGDRPATLRLILDI